MKITTQGNGIKIGPRLEVRISEKMAKFDKFFGDEGSFNVRIRPESNNLMSVEVTLKLDNKIYRAEAKDEDILSAIDKTIDKLESQIRKQKTKFLKKKKEYASIVSYLEDDNDYDYEVDSDDEEKIIKSKKFTLRPMTSDDAILQMEMLGHNFFVYLDSELDSICVLYKRHDGNYGILEPEY